MILQPGHRFILGVALLLCVGSSVSEAAHFQSTANGYSLRTPDGWVRIPDSAVEQTFIALSGVQAQGIKYEAGFQAKNSNWFTLPYILVQVTPYPNGKQPGDADMKTMMENIAGAGLDLGRAALAPDARPLVQGMKTTVAPELDWKSKSFTWQYEMSIKDHGGVKGISRGHFGKQALVTLHCYMAKADTLDELYGKVLDSFKFESSHVYQPQGLARLMTGAGRNALLGVAALLFGGLFLWSRRQKLPDEELVEGKEKEIQPELRDGRPYF